MTYEDDVDENNINQEEIKLAIKEMKNGSEDMIDWLHTRLDGRNGARQ